MDPDLELSVVLSYFGFKVFSIDNNQKVIEVARRHNRIFNGRAKFLKQDAFSPKFKKNFFDLVYSQGFLEHFSDEEIVELLNEQLRVAPVVIFSVPNNYYGHRDRGDERLMSKKRWEKILSPFNVVKSENYYTWPSFVFKRKIFWLKPTMYLAKIKR